MENTLVASLHINIMKASYPNKCGYSLVGYENNKKNSPDVGCQEQLILQIQIIYLK